MDNGRVKIAVGKLLLSIFEAIQAVGLKTNNAFFSDDYHNLDIVIVFELNIIVPY